MTKGEALRRDHATRVTPQLSSVAAGLGEQCLSDYSFANLWLFRREHGYRFTDGPWPSLSGVTYDGMRHVLPLFDVAVAPPPVLDGLLAQHDCLYPLTRAQAAALDATRYVVEARRDDADYLYPADQFRHYRGRLLQKKRNLMKQLLRDHQVCATPFGAGWEADARRVLDGWMRDKRKPAGSADEQACLDALAGGAELGLQGYGYTVDGEPGGFLLAEAIQPGVCVVRFAKSLHRFKGLAQYMFHHFCMSRADVRWINFEQDLGLPNFRQTKLSYQPAALLDKYRVRRLPGVVAG